VGPRAGLAMKKYPFTSRPAHSVVNVLSDVNETDPLENLARGIKNVANIFALGELPGIQSTAKFIEINVGYT
jgi:hypothetical protein